MRLKIKVSIWIVKEIGMDGEGPQQRQWAKYGHAYLLIFSYSCFRTNFNTEALILPCIVVMFSGFHNHLEIFYLNLPVFQWEREGLLFLIYRIENWGSECNPVSTSWSWSPEPLNRPPASWICHQVTGPCPARPTDFQGSRHILGFGLCYPQCSKAWGFCTQS